MSYAEVAVNAPVKQPRTFSYRVPQGMSVVVGQGVWVPFGPKTLQGIVCQIVEVPAFEQTKDIISLIGEKPLLAPWQVALARWISDYYFSSLFTACALMLPPGFERKLLTFVRRREPAPEILGLLPDQEALLRRIPIGHLISLRDLSEEFGRAKARLAVQVLARKGVVERIDTLEREKVRPKKIKLVSLAVGADEARKAAQAWETKYPSRAAVVELLLREGHAMMPAEIREKMGGRVVPLTPLLKAGTVAVEEKTVRRDPLDSYRTSPVQPPILTPDQEKVWEEVDKAFETGAPATFLLHGVTASGKTEIYLRAVARAVAAGKRAIVLVPEISLTPQTITRFLERFPGRVAALHSRLSPGEQYDEWWRIRNGGCDVVIGPRSAIFAPQPDLGLIVMDEEHEWTYKQKENQPLYHARDVALKIGELVKPVVLLGSATPDVSSYYRAKSGDYRLLTLPERVSGRGKVSLPPVEIVDMRAEFSAGNRSLFSRSLVREVRQALKDNGQVILFLNRRGANTFIQCHDCGLVLRCRRCEVSLVYHRDVDKLVCHQCNYKMPAPEQCPRCSSKKIKFLGSGTQRVEDEAAMNFEGARLLRWDRDVTKEKHAHEKILEKFTAHEADILIGTQMIAKGLDIPAVTLVGIINADVGLFLPDFRAAERTFQVITQVAGRAGRGPKGGKVIIQTYNPTHYAVVAASHHDYGAFYEREMGYRRELGYPPYSPLVRLSYQRTNETACKTEAERVAGLIADEVARGISDVRVLGPVPAFIARRRGHYEWQLLLKGNDCHKVLTGLTLPSGWTVDVDPVGLG